MSSFVVNAFLLVWLKVGTRKRSDISDELFEYPIGHDLLLVDESVGP